MSALNKTISFIDNVNDLIGRVFALAVLLMFVLVLLEVVLRYVFDSPTVWTNELTQMIFGAYVILSGGYILRWGGHVNVDIIFSRLSPKGRALLDMFTFVFFMCFALMMLIYGGIMAWESMKIWEHSESAWNPPIYPVKLMIPLGALLLILQGLCKLTRDILTLSSRKLEETSERVERETL